MVITLEEEVQKKGFDDVKVYRFINTDTGGIAEVMDEGLRLLNWTTQDKKGNLKPFVWGYDTVEGYRKDESYQGCLAVGQVANRIKKGQWIDPTSFELVGNLDKNNDGNTLHGGEDGWHKKTHKYLGQEQIDGGVEARFKMEKKDGEMGFPGNVTLITTLRFFEDGSLEIEYEGNTNAITPMSPTAHMYFNLNGTANDEKTIRNHMMQSNADRVVIVDDKLIPTGEFGNVTDAQYSRFNFNKTKRVGYESRFTEDGYDNNLLAPDGSTFEAKIWSPGTEIQLDVSSNMPAGQFYTGKFMEKGVTPGGKHTGFCIEPGPPIDAINHPEWEAHYDMAFAMPGQPFKRKIRYTLKKAA